MKCFKCHNEINESQPYEITAPDGDCFHVQCLFEYETEKVIFYETIINDDDKFNNWIKN